MMKEIIDKIHELSLEGNSVDETIEQLIIDGFYYETHNIRTHLRPIVNELYVQFKSDSL